jgi:uncharacterized membrane protein YfcA
MEPAPEWFTYPLAVAAGVVAGFVNTLAGSGSFLTLPALIFLGLPAHVANGTNRIGVLLASAVSVATFRAGKAFPRIGLAWLVLPSCAGAVLGAYLATGLDPSRFDPLLGALMLAMLALVLFDPTRRLAAADAPPAEPKDPRRVMTITVFFAIGVYGGFIQAGVGLFLLTALVLDVGLRYAPANAVKNLVVLLFTLPATLIFAWKGDVDWGLGLLLAAGQMAGAWAAARFATRSARAEAWIRRLLIVVLALTAAKLFGLLDGG